MANDLKSPRNAGTKNNTFGLCVRFCSATELLPREVSSVVEKFQYRCYSNGVILQEINSLMYVLQ